ncbi:MAG: Spo0B C-terminal domain-containing protein [Bacillus sp. (in: firmicutes)]
MKKNWGILELLGYSRHDWLNKIQLIKGNVELGKIDDVKEIINQIVNEAKHEAELSNLNMPRMAELLLTGNWMNWPFSLEYEVLSVSKGCSNIDEYMYNWTVEFIQTLSSLIDLYGENALKITIYCSEQTVRFTFDLQGKIKEEQTMTLFLQKGPSLAVLHLVSFTEEELVFEIEFNVPV